MPNRVAIRLIFLITILALTLRPPTSVASTYPVAVCVNEFAADYETVDQANGNDEKAWDADIAPFISESGDELHRMVWEGRTFVDPGWTTFYSIFRASRHGDLDTEPPLRCCLGKAGNPEVFGEVIVKQQKTSEDADPVWIRIDELSPSLCDQSLQGLCSNNSTIADRMHPVYGTVCANDPDHSLCGNGAWQDRFRIAAVTDGRFMVWNEHFNLPAGDIVHLTGYRLPADSQKPGVLFQVTSDPMAITKKHRIIAIDALRSLVVFNRCPVATDCDETAEIHGVYLDTVPAGDAVSVSKPFRISANDDGGSEWSDAHDDLVVWEGRTSESREIFGCQAPRDANDPFGRPDFTRCHENIFQIVNQPNIDRRPAVWNDVVAWGHKRTTDEQCNKAHDILVHWLARDSDGAVMVDRTFDPPRAVGDYVAITDLPSSRQRNPRMSSHGPGSRVTLLWPDSRFAGCPTGSDLTVPEDAIGAEIAQVPVVQSTTCTVSDVGRATVLVDLRNDWPDAVTVELDEIVQCTRHDATTGVATQCADNTYTRDLFLESGITTVQASCSCAVGPNDTVEASHAIAAVRVTAPAACAAGLATTRIASPSVTCTE